MTAVREVYAYLGGEWLTYDYGVNERGPVPIFLEESEHEGDKGRAKENDD